MTTRENTKSRLKRAAAPLPTEADFDPAAGCLDARGAWKHFGGLSLQQAYDLFVTNPLRYQEDFMFMGSRAFEYYLPVIDRYLREVTGGEDSDGCQAAILGSGVLAQCDWRDSALLTTTVAEIKELSAFVRANLARFSSEPEEQSRIDEEWKLVDERAAQMLTASRSL
jgi:hypothetical protein